MASASSRALSDASRGMTSHRLALGDDEGARRLRQFVALARRDRAVATAQSPDGRLAAICCEDLRVLSEREQLVVWTLPSPTPSAAVFERATHFALNVTGRGGADWLQSLEDAGQEKFSRISFEFGPGGAPLLECAVATLECVNRPPQKRGTHAVFVGRALKVRATEELTALPGEINNV